MTDSRTSSLEWVLRVGAFMCFVGHGAFGILTKEAWVPYFAVVGIGRDTAYALMPMIGALDVAMGCLVLLRPMNAALVWMTVWALWTAALRPLSGEPMWEALERAGNYGVPAALLLLGGPVSWRMPLARFRESRIASGDLAGARRVLQVTVALVLVGHGALGVIGKHGLVVNYSSVLPSGLAVAITPLVGWSEVILALGAFARIPALLFGIAAWKVATEGLFLTAGLPAWELMERGGSYAAPVALAIILMMERESKREAVISAL